MLGYVVVELLGVGFGAFGTLVLHADRFGHTHIRFLQRGRSVCADIGKDPDIATRYVVGQRRQAGFWVGHVTLEQQGRG